MTSTCRATVVTLAGGPWLKQVIIFELQGNQYATDFRPPPHSASPFLLFAQSVLSNETAPPPQRLYISCQIPLGAGGSLRRKIIRNNWDKQKLYRVFASRNKIHRQ
jgi:hypothetical protein